jgi:signal transduction histidine kinase
MIDYIRQHWGAKLLFSYLAVILVGVVVLVSTTQVSLPSAYDRHVDMMAQIGIPNIGPRMMGGPHEPVVANTFYDIFRASFYDALTYAVLAAVVAAIAVSLFFSRGVIAPLRAMIGASQRIAAGHYDERVQVAGSDELGQLGMRFNDMASQLEQVESMRRQLIGDVSHELRTPLTAIKGYMEGLVDGVLPANADTFQQVHQEADRLSRLVEDLQELSRVESKAYQLDVEPMNIPDVVAITIKRLSSTAQKKEITLRSDLPTDLPLLQADSDRIIQVLTNLVGNALNYTSAGGTVTVTAARHAEEIRISVQDTGVGIPAEHLPHIFDRFYRVDKSRSRQSGGGSGIGLTVAKYLVEAHGGRIWIESKGEGQGSTFTFTLPVASG